MLPGQPLQTALALQEAAAQTSGAGAALPTQTRLQDGGVAFFGRSGLVSTGAGLLATLVAGLALAAGLLMVYERVSRSFHRRRRPSHHPHELVAHRLHQTPSDPARPDPLPTSRLAWILRPALKLSSVIPRYFSPTDISPVFLTDSQLAVRGLLLLALVTALYTIPALLLALPLFTIGIISTTRYTSGNTILPGLRANETIFGGFSSLDNFSILRLLHAQRLEDARVSGAVRGAGGGVRLALLVVFGLAIPACLVAWIVRRELAKAREHHRAAGESDGGGAGFEMAFLPVRGAGLRGMSETRLKEVLGGCGLGSSRAGHGAGSGAATEEPGANEISVEEVFAVQDLSALARLQKERESVVVELEVAECEYMAAFEPSTPPEEQAARPSLSTRNSHESSKSRRSLSKRDSKSDAPRPRSSIISPFAPLGHFTITPRSNPAAPTPLLPMVTPSARPRPSHTLSESFGRRVTGANFTEVGFVDRPDEFELGQKLRINEQGRWSKAIPTPGPLQTTFGFDKHDDSSVTSESPSSSPLSEKPKWRRTTTDADNGHRSSYISFPPPRSSSFGLAGLATLAEGSEEPLSEGDLSEKISGRRSFPIPDMDDLASIDSDSNEQHGRSRATRVDFAPLPVVPAIVVRKPSSASTNKRFSLSGWRRKKNPPPPLDLPSSDSRTASPLPEDPLLPLLPYAPRPAPQSVRLLSPTLQHSPASSGGSHPSPSLTNTSATAAAPRFAPRLRTLPAVSSLELANLYTTLRCKRSELKRRNADIAELQVVARAEIAEGGGKVAGFVLIGRRVGSLPGVQKIEGKTKEDVRWELLYQGGRSGGEMKFWGQVGAVAVLMCSLAVIPSTLAVADAPAFASVWLFARPLLRHGALAAGLATVVLPTLLLLLILTAVVLSIDYLSRSASISIARGRGLALRGSILLSALLVLFTITFGAIASASASLRQGTHVVRSLADGAVATAPLLLSTSIASALIFPLWSLARPFETARSSCQLATSKTPIQRFLALQPTHNSPSALLALPFLSLSALIVLALLSPLPALPVAPFLVLTALVARHNGFYRSLHSQETYGTYLITLVTTTGFLIALQPLLLGLILLAYRYVGHGAACLALSFLLAFLLAFDQFREAHAQRLGNDTKNALAAFQLSMRDGTTPSAREGGASRAPTRTSRSPARPSMASIFALLDSRGFSSVSLSHNSRHTLPLPELDLLDTFANAELASRLHPHAPPRLALRSTTAQKGTDGEEGRRTMYPPALVGGRPSVWLPRDELSEKQARELKELYGLEAVWEDSVELRSLQGLL